MRTRERAAGCRSGNTHRVVDAIVIGSGPNGLVAANHLLDAGWSVQIFEAQPEPGGAVKSAELIEPGYINDVFSAFYPLAVFSPAIERLELERYGLSWLHGPLVLAHPAGDGTCVVLSRELEETAASLDGFAHGDGLAWRRLAELWEEIEPAARQMLVTPMPPLAAGVRLLATLGVHGALSLVRDALLSVRQLVDQHFAGEGAQRLIAGNALHADFTPDSALGGFFGFLLTALGQTIGFPVPAGGAGNLTTALVRRLEARGGTLVCGQRVEQVLVKGGRATGVRTAAGEFAARRAVLADTDAPSLFLRLLPRELISDRVREAMRRFHWDWATVKVDWTLDGPVPWTNADARRAAVVHLSDSLDTLTVHATELARGLIPARPFVVFGQYSSIDPSRSPAGKETAWSYAHVPRTARGDGAGELSGEWREGERERFVERIELEVERLAPGFRQGIRGRHVLGPEDLEARDENLVGGALNGGTAQIHQQLVFRPLPGLGRPETPVKGLYLASASAHPGGGVHGGPGAIAARAALNAQRSRRMAIAVGGAAFAGMAFRRGRV